MSELFKISLQEMRKGFEENPNIEEWDSGVVSALTLLTQIGLMERLELMVELQAMTIANRPVYPTSIQEKIAQIKEHFGWKNNEGA